MANKTIISNYDIIKNKYSIEILENNINDLSLWKILQTQIVTADFCVKYFYCVKSVHHDESPIYLHDILAWQEHLSRDDIYNCDEYKKKLENEKIEFK
jgi:hypothetical protein